jgi:hypothetical protein
MCRGRGWRVCAPARPQWPARALCACRALCAMRAAARACLRHHTLGAPPTPATPRTRAASPGPASTPCRWWAPSALPGSAWCCRRAWTAAWPRSSTPAGPHAPRSAPALHRRVAGVVCVGGGGGACVRAWRGRPQAGAHPTPLTLSAALITGAGGAARLQGAAAHAASPTAAALTAAAGGGSSNRSSSS